MLMLFKGLAAGKSVLMLGAVIGGMSIVGVGCHQLRTGAIAQHEAARLSEALTVQRESTSRVMATVGRINAETAAQRAQSDALKAQIVHVPATGEVCPAGCTPPWPQRP